jgi:hypothetical protein
MEIQTTVLIFLKNLCKRGGKVRFLAGQLSMLAQRNISHKMHIKTLKTDLAPSLSVILSPFQLSWISIFRVRFSVVQGMIESW